MSYKLDSAIQNYLSTKQGLLDLCREDGYLDLEKLGQELNIKIFDVTFNQSNVSGAIRKDNNNWEIYLNKNHSINRKRFTAAHEIGHFFSYQANSLSKDYLDNNGSITDIIYRKNNESDPKELEANEIGAQILMPEAIITQLISQNIDVEEISKQLGVSIQAVSYRLINLGYQILL